MSKSFYKFILSIFGWKIVGENNFPRKCLVVAAPHTSNWDFIIGRCYSYAVGIYPRYLAKSQLFLPLVGTFFRWNGAIPVDRSLKNNMVDQITGMYNCSDDLIICLSPEGTRKRVDKWKTGFYHIAYGAKIPIVLLMIDYKKKQIGSLCQFFLSGNFEEDMVKIQEIYKGVSGKIPLNYNTKIY